jgi:hypothetical protein
MRGRKPKPTALHLAQGTWRPNRHGPKPTLPDLPPQMRPAELTEAELAERAEDLERRRRAILGEDAYAAARSRQDRR